MITEKKPGEWLVSAPAEEFATLLRPSGMFHTTATTGSFDPAADFLLGDEGVLIRIHQAFGDALLCAEAGHPAEKALLVQM